MTKIDEIVSYNEAQLVTAAIRHAVLTDGSQESFFDWLGLRWHIRYDLPPVLLRCPVHSQCNVKMEMMLSPHFATLFKVWEIKNVRKADETVCEQFIDDDCV